jgi:hypothetical protein
MKRVFVFATILLIALVLIAFFVINSLRVDEKPFYVGVTFCGNTATEAKLLIDKVKNYTNLFVLQSGPLQANENAVVEIGDYAITSGLHFAAFFDTLSPPQQASWIGFAEQRWGDMFAGVYYGDEPGGKMLDAYVNLSENTSNQTTGNITVTIVGGNIIKLAGGGITAGDTTYFPNGNIIVINAVDSTVVTYYPNGTITLKEISGDFFTMENGTDRISQVESYEEVLSRNPIPNCDAAAEVFVNRNHDLLEGLNKQWSLDQSFPLFTSDYALYWWDYLSGYDVMLAQFGWNNTLAQEIGLVRGAANLQGKDWGAMITWKYTDEPYLASGNEIYSQMRTAYECGAEYVVLFNYAENMTGPYGILKPEHFDALEGFWNDVVQNPQVVHGGVKAEAVLVLPQNYGWGMRRPDDTIWGLWNANGTSQQIWMQLQNALAAHGSRLDIVYEDPAYPVAGRYQQIYYWNQTS